MIRFLIFFFVGLVAIGCKKDTIQSDQVAASIFSEVESIKSGEPFWVGVKFEMKEGWHIYWKNPGDSGMATEIQWELPEGFSASAMQWPPPEKFEDSAGVTYGYKNRVFLPVQITPSPRIKEGQKIRIFADARWLACNDVCVPGKAKLQITLPVKTNQPEIDCDTVDLFSQFRKIK